MAKTTTYRTVEGLNRALRAVPKEASKELRDESQAIAADIATEAGQRGRSLGGVAKYVPSSWAATSACLALARAGAAPSPWGT
jgi:acyl-coenzyme A synthetase/AMP-(fatty) acid ligase